MSLYKKYIHILVVLVMFFSFACSAYAAQKKAEPEKPTVIDITSDKLEYFPDTDQFVATGNAKVFVQEENSTLYADKITYDKKNEKLIAEQNVKLEKSNSVINGDYTIIDLTVKSALIDHPFSDFGTMRLQSKEAIVEEDKIDAISGNISFTEPLRLNLSSSGSGPMNPFEGIFDKPSNKNSYTIRSKEIVIKCNKSKNLITVTKAKIFKNEKKVLSLPVLTFSTDKELSRVETMLPEVGSARDMGMYAGPGAIIDLPGSATLKLAPVIAVHEGDVGVGFFSRFMTQNNKTEMGWNTAAQKFVMNGKQQFGENNFIQYGSYDYTDEGLFGDRRAKYVLEAVHQKDHLNRDLNIVYTNRLSAGYAEDYGKSWGTTRLKAQGQLVNINPIYNFGKYADFRMIGQYSFSLYGSGNTDAVVRVGPNFTSKIGPVYSSISYFLAGTHDDTPFMFDKYYHGKSSLYFNEEVKLTEKVSLGYIGSICFSKDNWEGKLFTENQLFVRFGPDDLKYKLAFDSVRKRVRFGVDILIDSENAKIEFDKLKVINPKELNKPKEKSEKNLIDL